MSDIAIYRAEGLGREILTLIQNINKVNLTSNRTEVGVFVPSIMFNK